MGKIAVFDNYDSFTYNLVHYIEELTSEKVVVVRNDEKDIEYFNQFDTIFFSPGPGLPPEAGIMLDLIREYGPTKNLFGICLGMQGIAMAFGGNVVNLQEVYHGVATRMNICDKQDMIFKNVPAKFYAGRYHSWVVEKASLPPGIIITSEDEEGNIMSLRHDEYNIYGVQFHPESIMTPEGKKIIRNFLLYCT